MKWLKKLLGFGEFTPTPAPTPAPADAGAKAFDQMAKTLSAHEEKKPDEKPAVVAQEVKEVVPEAVKVEEPAVEAKPKAPRKPRAKKEAVQPLPQAVAQNVEQWPFPSSKPEAAAQKPKAAARSVKAK